MEVVVSILLVATSVSAFVVSETLPLKKDDIKIEAADLRSFAAVGWSLTEQYSAGQLTETFFRNQTELTAQKVEDAVSYLENSRSTSDVSNEHKNVTRLAQELLRTFDQVESSPNGANAKFSTLGQQLKQIEDRLNSK
jgi:hypothetical protein